MQNIFEKKKRYIGQSTQKQVCEIVGNGDFIAKICKNVITRWKNQNENVKKTEKGIENTGRYIKKQG